MKSLLEVVGSPRLSDLPTKQKTAMVDDFKRRTSNFFPMCGHAPISALGPSLSPSLELHQRILSLSSQPVQQTQDYFLDDATVTTNRTASILSTPSFLSQEQSFSLNLLGITGLSLSGLISPYAMKLGDGSAGPPSGRISYSAPNILNDTSLGRKLDFNLEQQLLNLGLEDPSQFRDLFSDQARFSLGLESPNIGHRLSLWSTVHREDVLKEKEDVSNLSLGTFSEPFTPLDAFSEDSIVIPHPQTPKFVSKSPVESTRANSDDLNVDPLTVWKPGKSSNKSKILKSDARPTDNAPAKDSLPNIVVKLSKPGSGNFNLPRTEGYSLGILCSRHVLRNLDTKIYPEDYCSTFYKRNKHGYMFIREPSSSLKVNSSGPKSWVTIKLKLGNHDTQKVKVDVRKLPEWKPINLNLNYVPRKHGKRDHRNKSIEGGHRSRKPQPRG